MLTVILEEIPYESYQVGPDGKSLDLNLPMISGKSKFINIADRIVVSVNINGLRVPFYLSKGYGGKKNVPAGKWYPFFGIGKNGWINKGKSEDIVKYYNSTIMKQIAEQLDTKIGDIRHFVNNYPKVGMKSHVFGTFLNRDMVDVSDDNEDKGALEKVYLNINIINQKLDNQHTGDFNKNTELKNNDIFYDKQKNILIFKPIGNSLIAHKSLREYFGPGRLELSNEQTDGKRLFYVKPTAQELANLTLQNNNKQIAQDQINLYSKYNGKE